MNNAPQLPHRPAPPLGTEWNTEFRRIQLKITKNTTMITDGLEMAWESLWKVRGDVGGRVEGKKKWYMCDYTGNRLMKGLAFSFSVRGSKICTHTRASSGQRLCKTANDAMLGREVFSPILLSVLLSPGGKDK